MPISYRIDHSTQMIEEVWSGPVTIQDLRAYWTGYLADPEVLAVRRTLVDLRAADIQFLGSELQRLVEALVIPALKGRGWRTAIIVSRGVQFGVSRQYQVFADSYSADAIFEEPSEAREWLLAMPAAP